tara:strand:+ start:3479 stop:4609 length:1131 start_codon:yes stop_codon:yes gene_type:complete
MLKVLINASNLHNGGGVQVATSFIFEFYKKNIHSRNIFFWVSSEVDNNLSEMEVDTSNFLNYRVVNTYGFGFLMSSFRHELDSFDVVFTLFGPLYILNRNFFNITGFAQAWIAYPDNEFYGHLPLSRKLLLRLKFYIQCWFFRRADKLLVELEHVRIALIKRGIIQADGVDVVHNCLSSLYFEPKLWRKIEFPNFSPNVLKLGYLGRDYSHKNTKILPLIVKELRNKYGVDSRLFVTFTENEWRSCSSEFREFTINVGSLSVSECPTFYQNVDAIVFPSLLECFSATPLEAMVMKKPLFVSDRPFNKDLCGDNAFYFDPLDAQSAASKIFEVWQKNMVDAGFLERARKYAILFSSPEKRAESYLDIINNSLKNCKK